MSDTVVVMNQGYIQQTGTPEDIYNEPINAFVADFIGESNIIDGIMLDDRLVQINGQNFECVDTGFEKNEPVDVVIRPEDVELGPPEGGQTTGTVTSIIFKGVHYEIQVKSAIDITFMAQTTQNFPVGSFVGINVIPDNFQIMHKPKSEDEQILNKESYMTGAAV